MDGNKYSGVYDRTDECDADMEFVNAIADLMPFINPDEAGEYPLMVDENDYLVTGYLSYVNGKKVKLERCN